MLARRARGEELSVIRLGHAGQARQRPRRSDGANDPEGNDRPAEPDIEACDGLERGGGLG